MDLSSFPLETLRLWRIRGTLALGVPLFFCLLFSLVRRWFLLPAFLLAAVVIWLIAFYFPRYFRSCRITFPENALLFRRGVWIQTIHLLPFPRLLYAQSLSTPLSRRMGLCALRLKAARYSLFVPELPAEEVALFLQSVGGPDKHPCS
ncbi:MAG: hypothetical protein IJT66_01345 [Clostridia bacterium]|nr:hypothetical protein [Clostridia bacterium]